MWDLGIESAAVRRPRGRRRFRPAPIALESRRLLASPYEVTTTADSPSGPGTLRAAILLADSNASGATVSNPLNVTITFAPALSSTPQTLQLTYGALLLNQPYLNVTIAAPISGGLTIEGNGKDRIFDVLNGSSLTLTGLTIAGGSTTSAGGGLDIQAKSSATLTDCTISGNTASDGGGIYNGGTLHLSGCTLSNDSAGYGGGLWSAGTATLTGCTLSGDSAVKGGGLLNINPGHVTLTNDTIAGNWADYGGGLANYGHANLTACTITGNTAASTDESLPFGAGGGIYNFAGPYYGAVANLVDVIVAENHGPAPYFSDVGGNNAGSVVGSYNLIGAGGGGGIVGGRNGNIVQPDSTKLLLGNLGDYGGPTATVPLLAGSVAIGAGQAQSGVANDQRGFALDAPVDIGAYQDVAVSLVVGSTGDGGAGASSGTIDLRGAIDLAELGTSAESITFDPSVFATAQAIALTAGPLSLSGTIAIDGPSAGLTVSGGGASRVFRVASGASATISGLTITGGSATTGGGLYNLGSTTLEGCSIVGDTATTDGGGIANLGTLDLVQCTIGEDAAGGVGAGIYSSGTASMVACTISGNTATGSGGGGGIYQAGPSTAGATLGDTIVAGNAGGGGSTGEIAGPGASRVVGTYNIAGQGGSGGIGGGTGDLVLSSLAGLLGPLGDYGDGRPTFPVLPGSPAIAAGSAGLLPSGTSTDERGQPRALGTSVDIGAFESQGFSMTAAGGSTPQSSMPGQPFGAPLSVTVSADHAGDPVAGGIVTFSVTSSGGVGASLSSTTATIAADGTARVQATAGGQYGSYVATASAAGAGSAAFDLTNLVPVAFSGVTSPSIAFGTASATITGTLADGQEIPSGQSIVLTFQGTTQDATIQADGSFRATFPNTGGLGVPGSPYAIGLSYAGDSTYGPATATATLTVTRAAPTVLVTDPGGTYDGSAFPGSATVAGVGGQAAGSLEGVGLTLSYYVGGSATGTASSSAPIAAGTYTVLAGFAGSSDYAPASATATFTIAQATPTITWTTPSAITYGTALGGTQLDATASVAGSFAYSPASGSIPTAGTDTLSVTFAPADATDYTTATASVSLVVRQATPTITWTTPSAITYGTALGPSQLDATASVGGTFAYSPAAGTVPGAGTDTLSVTFTPTDSTDYATATASVSLVVNPAAPTITWTNPSAVTYGTALGSSQLDATANVAGSFAYSPASGTILGAGTKTLSVTFTPTDATDYTTATATVSLVVNQAAPSITWPTPSAIIYGTALGATQLDATSTVAGSFAYSPASGSIPTAGTQTLSVTLTPTDTTDYTTATKSVSLVVNQAAPVITWPSPASIVYGTALGPAQLDATASVGGTFAYSPASGSVPTAGTDTLSVTFTPTDSTDFATATATTTLIVSRATPTIAWPSPSAITYGTALGASQLDATSTVAGSFAYSPASGSILGAGTDTLSVTLTPTDSTDYTTATMSVSLVVNQATPTITWATPSAITYGTALSATQLDATSTVAGTFSYSPASGSVLGAGTNSLSVTLTPTDSTDYTSATASVSLVVNQATPSIDWPTPTAITYGTALGSAQLDATSTVAGTFAYSPASGSLLTAGTNTLSVTLTPTDTTDYTSATASVSLVVNQATPTITWPSPDSIVYGTALGATQLDASASVPGTFTYSPAAGALIGAGTQTLSVTFTPNDTQDEKTVTASTTIVVGPATPMVSVVGGGTYDGRPIPATATVAGIDGTPSSTLEGIAPALAYFTGSGTALSGAPTSAGSYSVVATFPGSPDYASATAQADFTIARATPAIDWPTPSPILVGTALGAAQLDASSTVAGTFTYNPPLGTILPAGTQSLQVAFAPSDPADYTAATATVSLVVQEASGLTWASPSPIVYGTALGPAQLDATSNVPGKIAYSPPAGTVLHAGTQTLSATLTPDDLSTYAPVTTTVTLVVQQATPTIAWPSLASFVYGTALGPSQLDATANVAGTFSYSPTPGTILGAGTRTIRATFTPADATDYADASASATLAVEKATPTVSWSPSSITFGTTIGPAQQDATADVPGTFAYSVAAGTVLGVGTYRLSSTFTPADAADFTTIAASATIAVAPALPTLIVHAGGGTFDGSPFSASATIAGVGGAAGASLEGVTPTLTYFSGSSALGGPPTGAGSYAVVATFPGSPDYAPTTSAPASFTIGTASSSVALSISGGSAVFGQPLTVAADVAGPGTPAGSITFLDGGTPLGTVALDASGRATLTVDALGPGAHAIAALYSGDADRSGGRSSAASISVQPAATQIVLVPHPVFRRKKIVGLTLTAEVEPIAPGGGVPSGSVSFVVQINRKKQKILANLGLGGGQATLSLNPRSVLNKSLTLAYAGGPGFLPSQLAPTRLNPQALAALARTAARPEHARFRPAGPIRHRLTLR